MASRWKQLIQIATGKMIPFRDLFSYVMVGALYNNLLPGAIGGDIVRAQALSRQHDISLKTSAKISIVERAIGLSGVLFLICATAPFANIPYLINPTIVHFLSPLTMIFLGGICYKLCKSLSSSTMTWKKMVSISALLLLAQMSDILILHFFLYVQEVSLDPINLIFCVTLAYIAAALPISLGGLGVREGVLISMFALNGVAVPVATLASMLLLCTRLMTSGLGAIVHIRKSI